MKIFRGASRDFVPASHENSTSPGVWKKVLATHTDFQQGRVQMINWAKLPAGNQFAAHYHEDMQEVFIIIQGQAEMIIDSETIDLGRGDAILIEPHEVHTMRSVGQKDTEYVVVGVSAGAGGRTVVVS